MADKRKLQTEIDRCLKQVAEHLEIFQETWDKIFNATNQNQKEKFEGELKREIKKLQKFREQIKAWLNGNEAKAHHGILAENRRAIEVEMERYRDLERDTKTKAYSNEGLDKRSKMDPEEKEKQDCRDKLNKFIEEIKVQMEMVEAEAEAISGKKKKKMSAADTEQLETLQERIERHKFFVGKIEMLLRGLDNGNLEPSQLEEVHEGVQYHLDDNTEDDYYVDEYLFDEVEQHLRDVGAFSDITGPQVVDVEDKPKEKEKKKEKEEKKKKTTKKKKKTKSVSGDDKSAATSTPPTSASTPLAKADAPPTPTTTTTTTTAAAAAAAPTTSTAVAEPAAAPPQPSKWGTGINFAAVASKARVETVPANSSGPSVSATTRSAHSTPPSLPSTPATAAAQPRLAPHTAPTVPMVPPVRADVNAQAAAGRPPVARQIQMPTGPAGNQAKPGSQHTTPATHGSAPLPMIPDGAPASFPADLAFPGTSTIPATATAQQAALEMSMLTAPTAADKPMIDYKPQHPTQTPSYYPQQPPSRFNGPEMFKQLDTNTLFFAFYYQQGRRQQLLAAQELKRQAWRYHKRFQTWFQRNDKPVQVSEEAEQGTYFYFDFEQSWCQRKRDNFTFEYRYLEEVVEKPR